MKHLVFCGAKKKKSNEEVWQCSKGCVRINQIITTFVTTDIVVTKSI